MYQLLNTVDLFLNNYL